MATKYPDKIDGQAELPLTIDRKTPVVAEVVNNLRGAIIAIEAELGEYPSRDYGNVRTRIDSLESRITLLEKTPGLSEVLEEGTTVLSNVTSMNFIGPAITATPSAIPGRVNVTVTATGGSTIFQEQETLPVTSNGQTAFVLTQTPQDDTAIEMFVNGFKQEHGVDYTASDVNVTYAGVPLIIGDIVEFWYISAASIPIGQTQETIAVTAPGQTSFILTDIPVDQTAIKMYVNGQKQDYGTDYTATANVVTYASTPLIVSDIVEFWYIYSGVSASGGGGGGEGLTETLAIGNITDGYDIVLSSGDAILSLGGVNAADLLLQTGPATGNAGDIILDLTNTGAATPGIIQFQQDGSFFATLDPTNGLKVYGDGYFDGKLTVTGSIDPTDVTFEESGLPTTSATQGAIFVSDGTGGLVANNLYYRPQNDGTAINISSQTLSEVLFNGNTTDGYNIIFSDGDDLLLDHSTLDFNIQFNSTVAGTGRDIIITAQESTGADGGDISITAGYSSSVGGGTGGRVNITSGDADSGDGGAINITAGNTNVTGWAGGGVNINGGRATAGNSNGGTVFILSGQASGSGEDGDVSLAAYESSSNPFNHGQITFGGFLSEAPDIYLRFYRDNSDSSRAHIEFDADAVAPTISQANTSGATYDIFIIAQSTSAAFDAGNVFIEGGTSNGALDGYVQVSSDFYATNTTTLGDASTGLFIDPASFQQVSIGETHGNVQWAFAGNAVNNGAIWTFRGQTSNSAVSTGGDLLFFAGNNANANGGFAGVRGANSSGEGGDVELTGGAGSGSLRGGNVELTGGDGGPTGIGGNILLVGGLGVSSSAGGGIQITGGQGGTSGIGGDVTILGGPGGSVSGDAGDVYLTGGTPIDGYGGSIFITASDAAGTDQSGGDIVIVSGGGNGDGVDGSIIFNLTLNATVPTSVYDFKANDTTIFQVQPTAPGGPTIAFTNLSPTNIIKTEDAANAASNQTVFTTASSTGAGNNGGVAGFIGGNGNTTGSGGLALLGGGTGGTSGSGGNASVLGGQAGTAGGNAGSVTIGGGTAFNGDGGDVTITGSNGVGTSRSGGNVIITAGASSGGAGMDGDIILDLTTQSNDGYIRMQIDSVDAFTLDGYGVLFLADATPPPPVNPIGGGLMYSEGGAGKWRSPSGTISTFGTAEPHCPKCDRDFSLEWESSKYGYMAACMWCLVEAIEEAGIKTSEFVKKTKA